MKRLFLPLVFVLFTNLAFADVISTAAVIPLGNYPSGTFTSAGQNVPDAATSVEFDVARCTSATPTIWPNTPTTLSLSIEFSLDGGSTWQAGGGYQNSPGGIQTNRFGVEIANNTFITTIPNGVGRKIRASVTITNGPLRSQGSVTWLN